MLMDVLAHRTEVRTGGLRPGEERDRARWRACGTVVMVQPVPAPRRPQMLAQQQPGLGCEQADVEIVPLHVDPLADPARWSAVVGGLDLDAAIEMRGAFAVSVIAKRFERQRGGCGLLLG